MSESVKPGDVILDKYRVERVLGQGGMGVVVAARHVDLGELFAIKLLLPAALRHPQAVERFVREARAAAKLKGEHVAKVYDVGRLSDGRPYMVLEYLEGRDLKEIVKASGAVPLADAVGYVVQACEALAEAHRHGIVHRDLKPANLFLTRRPNGTPCVKVLDFGISRQLEPEDPEQHSLTKTGMIVGTPFYMSPEQMTRAKGVDPRSDIWSLGCVLYELVTGVLPFRADALTELVAKVLQEPPEPPRAHFPAMPPGVEAVLMRCLAKSREQRFQSVEELMEALRWSLHAPPTVEPPAALAASPTLQAAPTGALSANTGVEWGGTTPGATLAPARSRLGLVAVVIAGVAILASGVAWLALGTGTSHEVPSVAGPSPEVAAGAPDVDADDEEAGVKEAGDEEAGNEKAPDDPSALEVGTADGETGAPIIDAPDAGDSSASSVPVALPTPPRPIVPPKPVPPPPPEAPPPAPPKAKSMY